MEEHLHDDPVGLVVTGGPAQPARQAVNRVAPVGLAQRRLMSEAGEFILPILQPVRPGEKGRTPGDRTHLILLVAVDHVASVDRIGAQTTADFGHDGALSAVMNDVLPAGWWPGG